MSVDMVMLSAYGRIFFPKEKCYQAKEMILSVGLQS